MTLRRFFASPAAFDRDERTVTLSAEEARHARDVLRLRAGDEVYIFNGAGKEFRCAIREFMPNGAILNVTEEVEATRPESSLQLTLGVALLKGEKFELVIQKCVELGVTRFVPVASERSDLRLRDEDAEKRLTRWRRIALEAAKQSGRACVPEIATLVAFESFIGSINDASVRKLFFAERDGRSLSETMESLVDVPSKIGALVGPEGGWSDQEIAQAREADWQIITLGGRTLRAETAAIAIVTLLQHRFGDLS
jgi:16S rRNA (uracil1498-N3)-methyltransferase